MKVVVPLVRHLPTGPRYRVIMVRRGIEEVLASQNSMLARLGRPGGAANPARLAVALAAQFDQCLQLLRQRDDCRVLLLEHRGLLADPLQAATEIAGFVQRPLDVEAMARVVEPTLYRSRGADR